MNGRIGYGGGKSNPGRGRESASGATPRVRYVSRKGSQSPAWLGPGPRPARCSSRVLLALSACTAYTDCMQYTIRGIPPAIDNALRARARAAGKSLNEAAVAALAEGAGVAGAPRKRRDLGDIAGTWKADKALESALAAQDRVDKYLWR